jgi:hypothetical protein
MLRSLRFHEHHTAANTIFQSRDGVPFLSVLFAVLGSTGPLFEASLLDLHQSLFVPRRSTSQMLPFTTLETCGRKVVGRAPQSRPHVAVYTATNNQRQRQSTIDWLWSSEPRRGRVPRYYFSSCQEGPIPLAACWIWQNNNNHLQSSKFKVLATRKSSCPTPEK